MAVYRDRERKVKGLRDVKWKWMRICVLSLVLLLLPEKVSSEGPEKWMKFSEVVLGEGGFRKNVRSFTRDERGFVWIGTLDGLVRCDGKEFTVFRTDPDNANSISGNGIWALCSDKRGNIWAGTWGPGLNSINIRSGSITHFRRNPTDPDSLSDDRIRSLYSDPEGRIWIGTEGAGVLILNPGTGMFSRLILEEKNSSFKESPVFRIVPGTEGRIWMATDSGAFRYDPVIHRMETVWPGKGNRDSVSPQWIRDLVVTRDGFVWLATGHGLVQLNAKGELIRIWGGGSGANREYLQHSQINCLMEDRRGGLWVGYLNSGLDLLKSGSRKISHFFAGPDASGLVDDRIICMLQDDSGLLWFGFMKSGVSVANPRRDEIEHYMNNNRGGDRSIHSQVNCIYKDSGDHLWFGTEEGLERKNPETGEWHRYRYSENGNRKNKLLKVWDILEDSEKRIWAATWNEGILSVDPETGKIRKITNLFQSLRCNCLYRADGGKIWVGTDGGGLSLYDPNTGHRIHYRHDPKVPESISCNIVMDICEAGDGGLWIATWGGGLNHLDPATGIFRNNRFSRDDPSSISSDIVLTVTSDRRGRVWAGTYGGGLNRLDPREDGFRRYNEANGMPDNMVVGVLEDDHGQIWAATSSGLTLVDPESGQIRNYGTRDGLPVNGFSFNTIFRDRSGKLYFGGTDGVVSFFPEALKPNPYVPPVHFSRLHLFATGRESVCLPDSPDLSIGYRDSFRITFTALDYSKPSKNRYAYSWGNGAKKWLDLGNQNSITFSRLQPGRYSLYIRGRSSDGIWNKRSAHLKIRVSPPFWQSWWFRLILLLIVCVAAVRFHRTRMRRQAARLRRESEISEFCQRYSISNREQEVLVLLLDGLNGARIANRLFISEATVKNHIYSLYRKLNIRSRAQLFKLFSSVGR